MQSRHVPYILGVCAVLIAAEATYIGYKNRDVLAARMTEARAMIDGAAADMIVQMPTAMPDTGAVWDSAMTEGNGVIDSVRNQMARGYDRVLAAIKGQYETAQGAVTEKIAAVKDSVTLPDVMPEVKKINYRLRQEGEKEAIAEAPLYLENFAQIEPAAGDTAPPPSTFAQDAQEIQVEAVLVPQQVTVVSSSRDGRIKAIHVDNGDTFKKGDLLIEYDCDDLTAETDIVAAEKDLAAKKTEGTEKLFKLDLISDLEKIDTETKTRQVDARIRLYQARMQQCNIYAGFNGRVTNRLANANEYTRTDRVLMEIASADPLRAEFLIPSKWLRWINVGAPINITLNETEREYTAHVTRIYGEVDPVSQSIQVVATMDAYADPLLPGMSGQAMLNSTRIRDAGVTGYLDSPAKP